MAAQYSIIQYTPDPVADERVNVGVVVVGANYANVHFISNLHRLKCLAGSPAVKSVRDFAKHLQDVKSTLDAAALSRMHETWRGTVVVSEPRGSLHEAEHLLWDVANRFLVDPPAARPGHLVRTEVQRHVRTSLIKGLVDRIGGAGRLLVKSDVRVSGEDGKYRFDLAIANGTPRQLVQSLSFQGESFVRVERDVNSTAYGIERVRRRYEQLPISVVAAKPIHGNAAAEDEFGKAETFCAKWGVDLVAYDDVGSWAQGVSERIAGSDLN